MQFVRNALHLNLTDEEASLMFTKMIEASLSARSTKLNFFIHNLAQRKASISGSSSAANASLLSFNPDTASLASDGRIVDASVIAFEKRYDHEQVLQHLHFVVLFV